MFTVEQIKAAHSKVKSGADFPAYIQDLSQLGITSYETFVIDGRTDYFDQSNVKITSPAKYGPLKIADGSNMERFKAELKEHQEGKTDYPTFIEMTAKYGVQRWVVSIIDMTCTYFDKSGYEVLVEEIPH